MNESFSLPDSETLDQKSSLRSKSLSNMIIILTIFFQFYHLGSKRVENLAFFSKKGGENGNVTFLMSHKSAIVKILIFAKMVEFRWSKWSNLRRRKWYAFPK